MNYISLLKQSAKQVGNCACMGLDPQWQFLPNKSDDIKHDIVSFFNKLFIAMKEKALIPSAFKLNIGYYSSLDKPRNKDFSGSEALTEVMDLLQKYFLKIPIILDSKRGDIARSSLNYAIEAFDGWKADAITISPYMGSDSILPFISKDYEGNGCYVLNRTSNPGGVDFQNLKLNSDPKREQELYKIVAQHIANYAKGYPGTGAVVGATGLDELKEIAQIYAGFAEVPLLIPGVGSQGASAKDVLVILRAVGYDLNLVRINSSSALTHSWKNYIVPKDYMQLCLTAIESLLKETNIGVGLVNDC